MTNFKSIISPDATVAQAIPLMNSSAGNRFMPGIAVVVDDERRVVGLLSDGDIRRGLSQGKGGDTVVSELANKAPIHVKSTMSRPQMQQAIIRQARARNRQYQTFAKIVVVDDEHRFVDVVWATEIFTEDVTEKKIGVYGLGFVGLTLAAVLSSSDLMVTGIDPNTKTIELLKQGRPTFFERGLESLLQTLAQTNPIQFVTAPPETNIDVHLVAVGTPVDENQVPDLSQVIEVSRTIAARLKQGDLVVFRSTLPVGTMREVVLPILSSGGKVPGKDFFLAFAPERTVEGNALEELRTLPQIIGGYDQASYERTAAVFRRITSSIVEVESLEAAEMVKLMNNTYRDLVFAFANEVAGVCDSLNVNAFKLIQAANEGYPRNPIPRPSPGVGGLCLSKDPHLFCAPVAKLPVTPKLGTVSRAINSAGHQRVLEKLNAFAQLTERRLTDLRIFILGMAFKGFPATSDIRYSPALDLVDALPDRKQIVVKDFVVPSDELTALGVHVVHDIYDGFRNADAVLIMNNHVDNGRFNLYRALTAMRPPALFFDGWNMFNQHDIEHIDGVRYATLGYMTQER